MAPLLELQNALAKISVDPETGELLELVNLAAGEDYLRWPGLLPGAPLRLVNKAPKETVMTTSLYLDQAFHLLTLGIALL
ncbi:MAG TPA: hypothetical protein GXX28_09985 [Firmicutes bacterium]|nr:hypothetical protein [Bacillota bacterium]